jgi:sugar phosphate isomerase/epimerase
MYTRREFGKFAAGAVSAALVTRRGLAQISGLQIGLQTYVFTANTNVPRSRAVDACLSAMVSAGIRECDICAPLLDPPEIVERIPQLGRGQQLPPDAAAARAAAQQELARWRASTPIDFYTAVRKKFNAAGINIHAISLFPSGTPEQFTRTMDIADALGAKLVACTADLPGLKSLAGLSENRGLTIGIQGRPDMSAANPDIVAKPEQFAAATALAKHYKVMLDVGDATGRGWDTLTFVREHWEKIALLYIKDRRRDYTSVPFGEGDTPIRDILRLIRDKSYPIRCYLDCEYPTADRAGDIARSLEFIRTALS